MAVASSFIDSVSRGPDTGFDISLLLSSAVAANLASMDTVLGKFARCDVIDYHGFRSLWQGLSKRFVGHDVIFTVFGPAYSIAKGKRHICGFSTSNRLPQQPSRAAYEPPRPYRLSTEI